MIRNFEPHYQGSAPLHLNTFAWNLSYKTSCDLLSKEEVSSNTYPI